MGLRKASRAKAVAFSSQAVPKLSNDIEECFTETAKSILDVEIGDSAAGQKGLWPSFASKLYANSTSLRFASIQFHHYFRRTRLRLKDSTNGGP